MAGRRICVCVLEGNYVELDPDMERRTTKSLFEGLGSTKGKRQKCLSRSPLPSAETWYVQCNLSFLSTTTYCTSVLLAVVLFNSVSLYNFPDAGGNILFVSENKADCDAEIGKS